MSKICSKLCASVFAVFGQSGDDRCGDISVRNLFKYSATFCATISALDLGGIIISPFGASSGSTVVIHPLSFGFSAADDPVGFWVIVGLGSSFGFVVGGSVAEPCSQSGKSLFLSLLALPPPLAVLIRWAVLLSPFSIPLSKLLKFVKPFSLSLLISGFSNPSGSVGLFSPSNLMFLKNFPNLKVVLASVCCSDTTVFSVSEVSAANAAVGTAHSVATTNNKANTAFVI